MVLALLAIGDLVVVLVGQTRYAPGTWDLSAGKRAQRAVDLRFDRARVDGDRTATAFARPMQEQVAIEAVTADLARTIDDAIRPASQAVWLRRAG